MDFALPRASRARHILMLSLLSGLSLFQYASIATAAVEADDALGLCQIESLPQDVRDTLTRRFDGWKIQDSSNLVPKARQKWSTLTPLACPGIASGHFEESRSVSYALLLVPTDSSVVGYRLVVFTAASGQSFYGFKMLDQGTISGSGLFIHAVPVDHIFDAALKKQLRPKAPDTVLMNYVDDKSIT